MSNPFLLHSEVTTTPDAPVPRAADQTADYPYSPAAPQMTPERDRRVRLLAGSGLSLLVLCLTVNFGMVPLLEAISPRLWSYLFATWPCMLLGVIPAQAGVLSAWLVWSTGPFLRRLALHWATAAVLGWVWLAGCGLVEDRSAAFVEIRSNFVGALPLVSLAVQIPLWIARLVFGWRLLHDDEPAPAESPLNLRDLFLATLLVAVAIAFAQSMPDAGTDRYFWIAWAVIIPLTAVVSTIALLPVAPLLLATHRFEIGVVLTSLYAGGIIATMWLIVLIVYCIDPGLLAPRAFFVGISSLIVGLAGTLMLASLAARAQGYRLRLSRG